MVTIIFSPTVAMYLMFKNFVETQIILGNEINERQIDSKTERQIVRQIDRQLDRQIDSKADRQIVRLKDRQLDRQIDNQYTDI